MTAPIMPSTEINGDVVLRRARTITVDCPWCQRIMRISDGVLTLTEIAQKIHLPLKVCEKLVAKAVREHWLEVVSTSSATRESALPGNEFWIEVNQAVYATLGTCGTRLIQEAARMTRKNAEQLDQHEVENFLIALELAATEEQREQLNTLLDTLRAQYAA